VEGVPLITQPEPVESTVIAAFIPGGNAPALTVHEFTGAVPLTVAGEMGYFVVAWDSTLVTATFEYVLPATPSGIDTLAKLSNPPPPAGGKPEDTPPPPTLHPESSAAPHAAATTHVNALKCAKYFR
jgi:hypothetical protein